MNRTPAALSFSSDEMVVANHLDLDAPKTDAIRYWRGRRVPSGVVGGRLWGFKEPALAAKVASRAQPIGLGGTCWVAHVI